MYNTDHFYPAKEDFFKKIYVFEEEKISYVEKRSSILPKQKLWSRYVDIKTTTSFRVGRLREAPF